MLRALYWFVVVGAIRLGARGLWAGLVGFGLLPALILQGDLSGPVPIEPASTAQTYQLFSIIFGAIALLGLIGGLVATLRAWRTPARVS